MAHKKLLIVIGAGASKEYGLPIGEELKKTISNYLNFHFDNGSLTRGDTKIFRVLQRFAQRNKVNIDINPYIHAARQISSALPLGSSIDNYIHSSSGDPLIELCGKLSIARGILHAEQNSSLYLNPYERPTPLNFHAFDKTWLNSFTQLLTESCTREQIGDRLKSITFIIFNYDRCFEHYLYHALQTFYGFLPDEAAGIISQIDIYHPYGSAGLLPWQDQNHGIFFGEEIDGDKLIRIAEGIKTFTEGTDPESSEIVAIRQHFIEAEISLFLGFAYHQINLDLLRPLTLPKVMQHPKRYYGTSLGISESNTELIVKELSGLEKLQPQFIRLKNLNCYELFHEFGRSLSFV